MPPASAVAAPLVASADASDNGCLRWVRVQAQLLWPCSIWWRASQLSFDMVTDACRCWKEEGDEVTVDVYRWTHFMKAETKLLELVLYQRMCVQWEDCHQSDLYKGSTC